MKENRSRKSKRKKKKYIVYSLIGIFLVFYTLFWVGFVNVNNSFNNIFNAVNQEEKRSDEVTIAATDPISIALLGIDTGIYEDNDAPARSDAIIIATVNPNTQTTSLVSIPRDTYTLIDGYEDTTGYDYYDKITHAYAFGGTEMALNTIQELLNIPIDYYVEVDMQGLIDIVDAIGGIEVTSPLTFEYEGHAFEEGETYEELDGESALAFARMRYDDPEGDAGRQKREKMVIKAMLDKILSLNSIMNYRNILNTLEDNVSTDLTFDDLVDIYGGYGEALENYNQDSLQVSDMYLEEIYYSYAEPEERLRVSNFIRDQLELNEITVDDLWLSDMDYYSLESADYEEETSEEVLYEDTTAGTPGETTYE